MREIIQTMEWDLAYVLPVIDLTAMAKRIQDLHQSLDRIVIEPGTEIDGLGMYVGEVRSDDGQREGRGTFTFTNGNFYTGDFRNGLFHGRGVMTWKSGSIATYDGAWENGKQRGYGVEMYRRSVISRFSIDAFLNSLGRLFRRGEAYRGEFADGKRHGRGVVTYPDGTVYSGVFADGQPEGVGECLNSGSADAVECTWSDGILRDENGNVLPTDATTRE
jgi:hypothetical protein